MLLAIDTATAAVGAALHDGDRVQAEVFQRDPRRHGELLAPLINEALQQAGATAADLTGVVCGVGPGPFTGLRVGVVTALVLALSRGLPPPQGVCSLDALAHEVRLRHTGDLVVATDARRREVYWARYEVQPGGAQRVAGPGVARPAELPHPLRSLPAIGGGLDLYPEAWDHPLPGGPREVSAGSLADLALALQAGRHPDSATGLLSPEPLYLRRPDALERQAR